MDLTRFIKQHKIKLHSLFHQKLTQTGWTPKISRISGSRATANQSVLLITNARSTQTCVAQLFSTYSSRAERFRFGLRGAELHDSLDHHLSLANWLTRIPYALPPRISHTQIGHASWLCDLYIIYSAPSSSAPKTGGAATDRESKTASQTRRTWIEWINQSCDASAMRYVHFRFYAGSRQCQFARRAVVAGPKTWAKRNAKRIRTRQLTRRPNKKRHKKTAHAFPCVSGSRRPKWRIRSATVSYQSDAC